MPHSHARPARGAAIMAGIPARIAARSPAGQTRNRIGRTRPYPRITAPPRWNRAILR